MCDFALRLTIAGVVFPRLRVGAVFACNLGEVRHSRCDFDNTVYLLCTLLDTCTLLAAIGEVEVIPRDHGGDQKRNEWPKQAHREHGQAVGVEKGS